MASLAGLEQALEKKDKHLTEMALRRMRMLYGVLCSIGGIPMIFMGEEWGVLNDYGYLDDSDKAGDSRWIHRPSMDWSVLKELKKKQSVPKRIFTEMQALFRARKENPALTGSHMRLLPCDNAHTLSYLRWHDGHQLIVLANFSEQTQVVSLRALRTEGISHFLKDAFTGETFSSNETITLEPYDLYWLQED